MLKKNLIKVVAGIFHRCVSKDTGPEVLLFQRKMEGAGGGFFEFPGGKIEVGESEHQALKRELLEELAIEIQIFDYLGSSEFSYSADRDISLAVYFVSGPIEKIQLLDHDSSKWINRSQINLSEIALGDRPLMKDCFDYLELFYQI